MSYNDSVCLKSNIFVNSKYDIEYSKSRISSSDIFIIEQALDVHAGSELMRYLLEYGYLACGHMEFLGVTKEAMLESDMVKTTRNLHACFPETTGYIAIRNDDDGCYVLVDEYDNVWSFDIDCSALYPLDCGLAQFIRTEFEKLGCDICASWVFKIGTNVNEERICPACGKSVRSNFWAVCPNCGMTYRSRD